MARTDQPAKPRLHLTFDDGPGLETVDILDCLDSLAARATFFITGSTLADQPHLQYQLVKRMLKDGKHAIGNHTYSHTILTKAHYQGMAADLPIGVVVERVKQDFARNEAHLQRLFKAHGDTFPGFQVARLPGDGRFVRAHVDMLTNDLCLANAQWDVELAPNGTFRHVNQNDWLGLQGIAATEAGLPRDGSILLLHDRHWGVPKATRLVQALRTRVAWLHDKPWGVPKLDRLVQALKARFDFSLLAPVPTGLRMLDYAIGPSIGGAGAQGA